MIKKRLVGVVTIKDDWAVQSMGFSHYLPLGKPEIIIENLDRWGVDEILIQVIDRCKKNTGPDLSLLKKISSIGLGTPVIYGGGIKTVKDAVAVVEAGADRIMVDSLIYKDMDSIKEIGLVLGIQALIGCIPAVVTVKNDLVCYDYFRKKINTSILEKIINEKLFSEILLIDFMNEGKTNGFNEKLIELFPEEKTPLIVFGGISHEKQINRIFFNKKVSAIGIGNFLNYKEHAYQKIKERTNNGFIRKEFYDSMF